MLQRGGLSRLRLRQGGPSRLRLRRRLLLVSAPMIIAALLVAYKMISIVIVGNEARSAVTHHDVDALRDDIPTMAFANVIDPDNVAFARGDLAALQGQLAEADSRFSDLLSRTAASRSCPVRINLELVRETQGDVAVRGGRLGQAEQRYDAALAAVKDAPMDCFQGNSDPDNDRRAIRNDAAARLAHKLSALHVPPPPAQPQPPPTAQPPPPPPPAAPPPPAGVSGSGPAGASDAGPDMLPGSGPVPELRLDPGGGNPVDRLQQALQNSDAANSDAPGQSGQ